MLAEVYLLAPRLGLLCQRNSGRQRLVLGLQFCGLLLQLDYAESCPYQFTTLTIYPRF